MNKAEFKYITYTLMNAIRHHFPGSEQVHTRRGRVYFKIKQDKLYGLAWLDINEYAPGIIRFRSDTMFHPISKNFWPVDSPSNFIPHMEVTVSSNEASDDNFMQRLVTQIRQFAEKQSQTPWEALDGGKVCHYVWSVAGQVKYRGRNVLRQFQEAVANVD